jgi:hypothetical protein
MGFAERRLCQAVPPWWCAVTLLSLLLGGCFQDMDPSPDIDASGLNDAGAEQDGPQVDAGPGDAMPPPDADGDAGADAGPDAAPDAAPDAMPDADLTM